MEFATSVTVGPTPRSAIIWIERVPGRPRCSPGALAVAPLKANHARYREDCEALLGRSGSSSDPYVADRLAKIGPISGHGVADVDRLLGRADRAHAADPELGWSLLTEGVAHHRLGRPARSSESLKRCLKANRGGDAFSEALARVFLAMDQARGQQLPEARRSLDAAERPIAERLKAVDSDGLVKSRQDLPIYRIAHREAPALVAR